MRWKQESDREIYPGEDQICAQLSFKEYEDPFKDVKDFDDDSPDIPNEDLEKE